jgi:hypothetical protein
MVLKGLTDEKLQNPLLLGHAKVKPYNDFIGHYSQPGPNGTFHVLMQGTQGPGWRNPAKFCKTHKLKPINIQPAV